jgi:hypothetical protein
MKNDFFCYCGLCICVNKEMFKIDRVTILLKAVVCNAKCHHSCITVRLLFQLIQNVQSRYKGNLRLIVGQTNFFKHTSHSFL